MLSQPRTVLASRPRSRLGRRIGFSAGFRLFVGAFFGYALFAAGAVWGYHLELEEALERTADAAYLLFSRAPHYGAIATHWPPLAAILQVPLVLLLQIGGGSLQFGGNLLAALAAAGTLVVLERLFGVCDLSRRWRAALLLLYGLNPMVLFYAINGTSESLLLFWLCLAFYGLVCWWRGRPASASGLSGLAMSAAFLTRYESVVLAGAMALAFASGPPRRRRHRWMGLALFGTPVLYTVSFWLAFNLITMRSPFFFVRDASTDLTTLSLMVSPEQRALTAQLSASLAATLSFSGVRLLLIFPLGLPLIALAAWSGWRGGRAHARRLLQMLTGLAITSLAVQTLMLFLGLRLPGLRPFLLLIPISFILFAVLVSQWKQEGSSKGERCAAEPTGSRLLPSHPIWLLLFLASNAVTLAVMAHPAPATDEAPFVAALRSGEPMARFSEEVAVSEYLQQRVPRDAVILVDTRNAFPIVLRDAQVRRFVIPSDVDYGVIVADPVGQVDYVLLQDPHGYGWSDRVNRVHPTLYEDRWPYATLVRDFGGEAKWRLFRIDQGLPPPG